MKNTYLSIVIPAYNEGHNVRTGVLDGIYDYLKNQDYSWEVIIVDDGSSDKTFVLADRFAKKHSGFFVMKEPHRGKGGTVIAGMLKAKGKRVLFTDMDQATPVDQLEKILPKFKQGYDIVIGSRKGREGAPMVRKMMAYGFSLLRLLVLRLPYKDTQCGFKAFKKDASKEIFGKMKIYSGKMRGRGSSVSAGFDLEVLYLARKLGYKVAEVSVEWHHKEGTKVNPIKDSWEGLRDLLKVRLNAITGRYNL